MRFCTRPAYVDAVQYRREDCEAIHTFLGVPHEPDLCETAQIIVNTPAGTQIVSPGDWIVRDSEGDYFAVPDEDFRSAYEPVDEVSPRPDHCPICYKPSVSEFCSPECVREAHRRNMAHDCAEVNA
jgi:hypothetical protein